MVEFDVPKECKAIGHDPQTVPSPLAEQWHQLLAKGNPKVTSDLPGLVDYAGPKGVHFQADSEPGKNKPLISLENEKGQQDYFDPTGKNPEMRISTRWFTENDGMITAKLDPLTKKLTEETGEVNDGPVASFNYRFGSNGEIVRCSTNDVAGKNEKVLWEKPEPR